MNRREVIALFAASVAPLPARSQQSSEARRVGILFPGTLGEEREKLIKRGLIGELRSENFILIARSAEGDAQRLTKFANGLVEMQLDVILAVASGSLRAAASASKSVPIVALDLETDPVASGVAESLSRPGGNVTGIFFDAPEIAGKWVQVLREVLPRISNVALLYDVHLDQTQLKAGENTARSLGITTIRLGIHEPAQLASAFQQAAEAKVDAVLVHSSPIFVDQARTIADLARDKRLPSIGLFPIYARQGGLFSYGPDNFALWEQAGVVVGKVLRGAKPADFPIQRPTHFQFLINMRTAQFLQLTVPASIAALADEVIE
jgi:putative ABC transport system substrate-binding protein